jgi:hypothetical protein
MLFSYFQKREILRMAMELAVEKARSSDNIEAPAMAALSIIEAAIMAQERLVEKDGSVSDRLLLRLRKAKDGMIDPENKAALTGWIAGNFNGSK